MIGKFLNLKLRDRLSMAMKHSAMGGFTLLELLIVVAIASIVISALMGLIAELLQSDQRENARNEVQREMQMALNYMVSDLREAVFVYDSTPNQFGSNGTPAFIEGFPANFFTVGGQTATPVLAFWKPENINLNNLPSSTSGCNSISPASIECQNLQIQRRAYSLVVYLQVTNPAGDPIWKGRSRILRYQLSKYTTAGLNGSPVNLTWNTGFVDPVTAYSQAIFPTWPFRPDTTTGTNCQLAADPCGLKTDSFSNTVSGFVGGNPTSVGTANTPTLVDFVDLPNRSATAGLDIQTCPTGNVNGQPTYFRVPSTANTNQFNSFFSCVRNDLNTVGTPQDVLVYIRGNAFGRGGVASDLFLPTLYTRVTMRGIIDKNPQ